MNRSYLGVLVLACAVMAPAAPVTYTNYSAWYAAATAPPNTTVSTESFANNQINTPGLTLVDQPAPGTSFADPGGSIQNDEFVATPFKYSVGATWTFDQPMTGFGADWDMTVLGGLMFLLGDGENIQLSPPIGSTFDSFYGFTSTQPFTSVQVVWGTNNTWPSFGQAYTMDNLAIAYDPPAAADAAPEPASLVLLCFGLIGLVVARRAGLIRSCRPR